MEWLGIKEWVWILIFCYFGTVLLIPILFFIKWELWDRKGWIDNKKSRESDERFFKYKNAQSSEKIQIAKVRPQIKDIWEDLNSDAIEYWWCPVWSYFIFIFLFLYLICRPFKSFWSKFVKWFGNLKV